MHEPTASLTSSEIAQTRLIGVAGKRGSFSEAAARLYCSHNSLPNPQIEYLTFIEQVLTALEDGDIDLGIFAIENSNGGVVLEYLPAIGKHRFRVEKTFELDVHHALLVRPGTKREDVRHIVSQKQALSQCRHYLKRKWEDTDISEYIDTATAAKDLSEGKLSDGSAVVASRACADVYGLVILEESIQDLKFNYTVFIAATRLED